MKQAGSGAGTGNGAEKRRRAAERTGQRAGRGRMFPGAISGAGNSTKWQEIPAAGRNELTSFGQYCALPQESSVILGISPRRIKRLETSCPSLPAVRFALLPAAASPLHSRCPPLNCMTGCRDKRSFLKNKSGVVYLCFYVAGSQEPYSGAAKQRQI